MYAVRINKASLIRAAGARTRLPFSLRYALRVPNVDQIYPGLLVERLQFATRSRLMAPRAFRFLRSERSRRKRQLPLVMGYAERLGDI